MKTLALALVPLLLLLPGLSLAQAPASPAPVPAEVVQAPGAEVVVSPPDVHVKVETGQSRVTAQAPTEVQYVPVPVPAVAPSRSVIVQETTVEPDPAKLQYAARLYFHTHYRTRRGLFGRTIVRPRRVNDPAVILWEDYISQRFYRTQ